MAAFRERCRRQNKVELPASPRRQKTPVEVVRAGFVLGLLGSFL